MGILLTIAGIVVLLYTLSSVLGLWLSYQVMDALAEGDALPEPLQEVEPHHVELLANYAQGWRRYLWAVSIVALFTTLIAMISSSPLAFYALGIAIAVDTLLFLTYEDLQHYLDQTNLQERLIDLVQAVFVMGALALLMWINLRAGDILG
jgi:K+-transporting ATPase A subunit